MSLCWWTDRVLHEFQLLALRIKEEISFKLLCRIKFKKLIIEQIEKTICLFCSLWIQFIGECKFILIRETMFRFSYFSNPKRRKKLFCIHFSLNFIFLYEFSRLKVNKRKWKLLLYRLLIANARSKCLAAYRNKLHCVSRFTNILPWRNGKCNNWKRNLYLYNSLMICSHSE